MVVVAVWQRYGTSDRFPRMWARSFLPVLWTAIHVVGTILCVMQIPKWAVLRFLYYEDIVPAIPFLDARLAHFFLCRPKRSSDLGTSPLRGLVPRPLR